MINTKISKNRFNPFTLFNEKKTIRLITEKCVAADERIFDQKINDCC